MKKIGTRTGMGYIPYLIKPMLAKNEPMLKKERVQCAGDNILWSRYRAIDPFVWEIMLRERRDKVGDKLKKEALPENENIDLNFLFSTLKEIEKRNIERHYERHNEMHFKLSQENKALEEKIKVLEKKLEASEEMIQNIKDIKFRVNNSLDSDLEILDGGVRLNGTSIVNASANIRDTIDWHHKEMLKMEARLENKIGGVASSVSAKIRTYPI